MHTKANITYGQLVINPTICKALRKSLIPKKRIPRVAKGIKWNRTAALANSNKELTSLTCLAKVAGYNFKLILNSGSSVSVISSYFLKMIGRKIDAASN